eukprot:TRINITY_DN29520_c0_g1_i1.p1 TRINITY_DN29520_c0_g1~~TRINITY_DN29520_c0_g1_i1.p1  ORF type:complete len:886 (+),score=112.14 TRINITY_DN29520_c0_g1_i1:332-2989(+)
MSETSIFGANCASIWSPQLHAAPLRKVCSVLSPLPCTLNNSKPTSHKALTSQLGSCSLIRLQSHRSPSLSRFCSSVRSNNRGHLNRLSQSRRVTSCSAGGASANGAVPNGMPSQVPGFSQVVGGSQAAEKRKAAQVSTTAQGISTVHHAPAVPWAAQPQPLPPLPKDTSVWELLKFLARMVSDDAMLRWRFAGAFVLLIIGKVAGLAGPLLFKKSLDLLTDMTKQNVRVMRVAAMWLVLTALMRGVSSLSQEFRTLVFAPVGQATARRMEYWFFWHILQMDMATHLTHNTGKVARIIERGKRATSMIFRAVVFTFVPTFVELVLVCWLLARQLSPAFAIVVLLTFACYIAWTILLTKASITRRKDMNNIDNQTSTKVVDILMNYETVVQFNNQRMDLQKYDTLLLDYQKKLIDLEYISAALNGGQSLIVSVGLALVMAMSGNLVVAGAMTVGDLVLVNGLVLQLSSPLQFLGFLYRDLRQSLVDMENMFEMLGEQSKMVDGTVELPWRAEGARVDAENLEFSYATTSAGTRKVLHGVSIHASPGQSIALVGPSGSGKSTIVKLLLRLYDPSHGSLKLDGLDVRDLTQESLRQAVAVVPQETVLFNESISYNIGYGRLSASQEEIEQSAKLANLHDAIMRMPDGYKTLVGERGVKLSGGEKQRLAIARAFLKAPRLLICDEATSALDSGTEAAILQSLKELAAGRTCIFVAHRLSTIQHCDEILVMEMGRVVERGNHESLLRARGKYASMWRLQESRANDYGNDDPGCLTERDLIAFGNNDLPPPVTHEDPQEEAANGNGKVYPMEELASAITPPAGSAPAPVAMASSDYDGAGDSVMMDEDGSITDEEALSSDRYGEGGSEMERVGKAMDSLLPLLGLGEERRTS